MKDICIGFFFDISYVLVCLFVVLLVYWFAYSFVELIVYKWVFFFFL